MEYSKNCQSSVSLPAKTRIFFLLYFPYMPLGAVGLGSQLVILGQLNMRACVSSARVSGQDAADPGVRRPDSVATARIATWESEGEHKRVNIPTPKLSELNAPNPEAPNPQQ